jgi:3-deoxy-manno-octulosonate cytidylyltransferase (CMP-KDO synthetase)
MDPVVRGTADIATLATPYTSAEEWNSDAEVKVARAEDGRALYFSRAGIPWAESGTPDFGRDSSSPWLRHLGLYVYSRAALEAWVRLPPSPLERLERLEQLRPLEAGWRIQVAVVGPCPGAIEEPEDLDWAEARLRTLNFD